MTGPASGTTIKQSPPAQDPSQGSPPGPKRKTEQELAAEAAANLKHEGVNAGRPLPPEFQNPPGGDINHLCLDPAGNYRPGWFQVKIHKTGETIGLARQFFNIGGYKARVAVGMWVDVPAKIIMCLADTEREIHTMDIATANPLIENYVPLVIDTVPRFSYSVLPSA